MAIDLQRKSTRIEENTQNPQRPAERAGRCAWHRTAANGRRDGERFALFQRCRVRV